MALIKRYDEEMRRRDAEALQRANDSLRGGREQGIVVSDFFCAVLAVITVFVMLYNC